MKNKFLALFLTAILMTSCADSKTFKIDGKNVEVEPYGWFDLNAKNDSVVYKINTANVVWSVILSGTIVAPIILTGDQLWEPVRKKEITE